MFEIKPNSNYPIEAVLKLLPSMQEEQLHPEGIVWSGMNTYAAFTDLDSEDTIFATLPTGHTVDQNYLLTFNQTHPQRQSVVHSAAETWICQSLLKLSRTYCDRSIKISKEVFKPYREIIILNCIDFLYGHTLLKLLNAQRHLTHTPQYGLVVIIPRNFRWLVPEGVAEIWTVNISLRDGEKHYTQFNTAIEQELKRFDKVLLSEAFSHPKCFDISAFTGVKKHDFASEELRVTFIWREDRLWIPFLMRKVLGKLSLHRLSLKYQNIRVQKLFRYLNRQYPSAKFTVAGFGTTGEFPGWIEDCRVNTFLKEDEIEVCKIYAESRLVVGIHGSNMLLPSGHAGMTMCLLPDNRMDNFAQDILYQEDDARLAAFKYRYLPESVPIRTLASMLTSMIRRRPNFQRVMSADDASMFRN